VATMARVPGGWGLWIAWALASAFGLAIGLAVYLSLAVAAANELAIAGLIILSCVGGAILGSVLGIAQWIPLRRYLERPRSWIWASIAGGAIGGPAGRLSGDVVSGATDFVAALVLGGAVLGACIGGSQWLILRHEAGSAGWWVVACAVGLALGLAAGRVAGAVFYDAVTPGVDETAARILATGIFGTLIVGSFGAITGVALIWLLRRGPIGRPVDERSSPA
jgi:hypothetical protein